MKPFVFLSVLVLSFRFLRKVQLWRLCLFYYPLNSVIRLAIPLKIKIWKGNIAYQ